MKNYVQPGDAIDFVAPSGGVVGGAGFLLGTLFGVVARSAAQGETTVLNCKPGDVFRLPKAATITPAPGAILYWDDTNKNVTTTSASNTKIGVQAALAASGATDATVLVRLNGVA
ncbi:DUF2190 family protein [Bosea sp. BK604]|uniref:DUF2190 family protein n=1 Tax=Bosea sp. BK604 TaxID=2512180 RepID=UPI00104B0B27|nr:DUF2190 family protein [Bosea sp. BK604]TCR69698.1 putative RecA/RadA family phage recombinase [Bosea sp. BK604]